MYVICILPVIFGVYIGLQEIKILYKKENLFFISIFCLFAIWIGNHGLEKLLYEPMYYLQKIRWAQEFSIIKGLGNLFLPYGHESGHFLHLSILDSIPFIKRAFWNFSGYLLSLCFIYFFIKPLRKLLLNKREIRSSDIMKLLYIPILIHNCYYMHPGIGTDLPVFVFGSILAIEMYKMFFEDSKNIEIIFVCLVMGFISKMIFIPAMFCAFLSMIIYNIGGLKKFIKEYKLIISLIAVVFTLQIHRNIILTGYPFYPIHYLSLPVKWKLDVDEVSKMSKSISEYAKGLQGQNEFEKDPDKIKKIKKDWIKSRFLTQHRRIETLYPIIIGLIGLLFLFILRVKNYFILFLFLLPCIGQMAFWYLYAPDTRFSSFAFWWFASGLICSLIKKFFPLRILLLLPLFIMVVAFSFHTIDALGQDKKIVILKPSKFVPSQPESDLISNQSGLSVWVPKDGKKCDDSKLPCTQYFNKSLKLINSNNIEDGFIINK